MKKSKKILLSLTGLAAFATLPIAAISCQTPTKPEEPKKEDIKADEPKKDDTKAKESNNEALVAKVDEKAKEVAKPETFTFKLSGKYTNSSILAALEAQGASLSFDYTSHNIYLFDKIPHRADWEAKADKQVFESKKDINWTIDKNKFQLANPTEPTVVSSGKTKINTSLKYTVNKENKTLTIEFKGALFVPKKDPVVGTETFSVTLPIQLEEAKTEEGADKANAGTATPGSAGAANTPQGGDSAQTNPQPGNQGSTGAQAGGTDNQAQATPSGSAGTTNAAQGSEAAQTNPSNNAQGSGAQAGSTEPGTGAQNPGTGATENGSAETSTSGGSGSEAGTSSTTPSSTAGTPDSQAGSGSQGSSGASTASPSTSPTSSSTDQASGGTEASTQS